MCVDLGVCFGGVDKFFFYFNYGKVWVVVLLCVLNVFCYILGLVLICVEILKDVCWDVFYVFFIILV